MSKQFERIQQSAYKFYKSKGIPNKKALEVSLVIATNMERRLL